ncbi:MAG: hypothetical protein SF162_14700 [bacterium]|nr:hypothetical protein [bacterium]
MAQSAVTPDVINPEPRIDAGQMAWGVLLIAFAVFCGLCVVSGVGLNYFLFQSNVPMQTLVRVGRGTVTWTDATLIAQATQSQIELFNSAVISTDPVSQASMLVYDQYHNQLIALLTLKSDSSAELEQVARPRFDFSAQRYTILLEGMRGEVDVNVLPNLAREVWVTVRTNSGAFARIIRPGQYTVRVNDAQLQVVTYAGEALVSMGTNPNWAVPVGQRGTMQLADGSYAMQPARANLFGSGGFDQTNLVEIAAAQMPRPQAWGCINQQNQLPSGFFALTQIDGLHTLRLGRGGGANSHGETVCYQFFPGTSQDGRDVSTYGYLGVRSTFKIVGHSLSTCGEQGSECPLMLRMEYITVNGQPATWIHGFYTRLVAGADYPQRCDSCTTDHEIINENTWYTYDSGNLLALIPPEQRPRSLLNFRFYASGHEYDVYVSDMALQVGQVNPAPNAG